MNLRIALLLTLLAPMLKAQGDLEVRVIDVQSLLEPLRDASVAVWGLPIKNALSSIRDGEDTAEPEPVWLVEPDTLVNQLRDAIDPKGWPEGCLIRLNDSRRHLIVIQTPQVLDRLEATVQRMARRLNLSIEVEVLVVKANAAALAGLMGGGGVVSESRFNALMQGEDQGLTVVANASTTTLSGIRARIVSGRNHRRVAVTEVEVAQSSRIADPNVLVLRDGLDLSVRPMLLPDGRVHVRVQGGYDRDLVTRQVQTRQDSKLELPSLQVQRVSGNATLLAGEGFVLGTVSGDDEGSGLLIIRARSTSPVAAEVGDRFQPYPIAYLTQSFMRLPTLDLGLNPRRPDGGSGFREEPTGYVSGSEIVDFIRRGVTPRWWGENLYELSPQRDWLWVAAGPEHHRGVTNFLGALGRSRARSVTAEVMVVTLASRALADIGPARGLEQLRQILRSPAALRRFHAVSATEIGGSVELLGGEEYAYLREFNVEIAMGSEMVEPEVDTGFSGVYVQLRPTELTGDQLGLDYRIETGGRDTMTTRDAGTLE
ncbi:MAG: hypothetical protein KDB53_19810, partial [Planctomycetes bacterium]|nr:hypothetical protein [Planctomycetota bacterium]